MPSSSVFDELNRLRFKTENISISFSEPIEARDSSKTPKGLFYGLDPKAITIIKTKRNFLKKKTLSNIGMKRKVLLRRTKLSKTQLSNSPIYARSQHHNVKQIRSLNNMQRISMDPAQDSNN